MEPDSTSVNAQGLLLAAKNGDITNVRKYLDLGTNIEASDRYGETSLIAASDNGHLAVVRELLDRGANIEAAMYNSETSLIVASEEGHLDVVRELLARGANVEAANWSGSTSLHLASFGGHLDIVRELLARGANVNAADKGGSTSLHLANIYRELDVVRILLDHGADIEAEDKDGNTALIVASIDDMGMVIDNSFLDLLKLLLKKGADPYKENKDGESAYTLAKTKEIRDLLLEGRPDSTEWGGFTQDDFAMFEQIFGDPKVAADFSICPVCHSQVIRADGCMFMHHDCRRLSPPGLDKDTYTKYLTPGYSQIYWCTVCGRVCDNHLHKALGRIDGPVPGNAPHPGIEGQFFGDDCRGIGGGGLPEKLARFNAILKTAHEMQADAGKISVREAKNRLVKAGWEAPLTMDKAALEAQLASKTFPTPISSFPTKGAPGPQVAEAASPNIPYPDSADPNLLPIVFPNGEDVTLLDEVSNAVQFRHKKADGIVNNHDGELIGLENLMINVLQNDRNKNFASAEFGGCWNSGGGCTAKLYPDEIQAAINKSTLAPEVKTQYETILADYRAKFNRKFKVGGGKKGGRLQLRGTQMFPLATNALADCPLRKKSGKRRTYRKIRKTRRQNAQRKSRATRRKKQKQLKGTRRR